MVTSACLAFACDKCKHFRNPLCPGCLAGNKAALAESRPACIVYSCVTSQGIASCDECTLATCTAYEKPEHIYPMRENFEARRWWMGKLAKCFEERWDKPGQLPGVPSDRVVSRMRVYLIALDEFAERGTDTVASWQLARKVGVTSGSIRKDLSVFGKFGKRGVGYNVTFLRRKIIEILGLDQEKHVAWLGSQKLVQDPGLPERLGDHNYRIVAVFDTEPEWLGTRIGELQVMGIPNMREVVNNLAVDAAVIACSDDEAQWAADQLISAGVKALLNLTATVIVAPGHVLVKNFDVAWELFALSYYCGALGQR